MPIAFLNRRRSDGPITWLNRARGWLPLQVSPYAWWDASRADLVTLVGGNVSSWKDIIAGYDLVQGTGSARPAYSLTGFGGREVVTGDGLDDELTLAPLPAGIPSGATPCETFTLVDQPALPADTGTKSIAGIGGGSLSASRIIRRSVNTGVNRANLIDSNNTALENPFVDFSNRTVLRSIATGTQVDLEVNGVSAGVISRASAAGAGRLRFFASPTVPTASQFAPVGIVAHIITPLLSAGQAAAMYAYLNQRR